MLYNELSIRELFTSAFQQELFLLPANSDDEQEKNIPIPSNSNETHECSMEEGNFSGHDEEWQTTFRRSFLIFKLPFLQIVGPSQRK